MSTITRVVLVGQPNVGKSALFSRMTGVGVISSNYAGTTVEFEESTVEHNGRTINVKDLPGTYSFSKNSPDEEVAISMLRNEEFDCVIVVADSTNMSSSLVLCFEVIELGLPAVLALNKFDAGSKRFDYDIDGLSEVLGIPVVPVSAKTSNGVDQLLDVISTSGGKVSDFKVHYSNIIEKSVESIEGGLPDGRFSSYGASVKAMEGCYDFLSADELEDVVENMRTMVTEINSESPEITIGRERYSLSDALVRKHVAPSQRQLTRREKISDATIEPRTGIPILCCVVAAIVLIIVYVGSFLDGIVSDVYDWVLGNTLTDLSEDMDEFPAAVVNGINGSFAAILGLVIPYILVFYIILGVLEDSGYLTRIVVLLDTLMHRFGLHGGAAIPILVGIGCNVPAILGTRAIKTRRERLIISSLIIMVVPCSAQISIIMGITGKYAGIPYVLYIVALLVIVGCAVGLLLNKYLAKTPSNLAMELPELVMPHPRNILYKTWSRIKDFFVIAFPLLVVGSIVIELLLTYDLLDTLVDPFRFITVDMLGLPAACIICFIVGILRKEMAVGMLTIVIGADFMDVMTAEQFVVFGVVMATYVPCLATMTVLWKEMGWKDTLVIIGSSCVVALLLGTFTHLLFSVF